MCPQKFLILKPFLQEKRDNRRKTGSAGGKKFKYDDADKIIFEIIGTESPILDGLEIPEASGKDSDEFTLSSSCGTNENNDVLNNPNNNSNFNMQAGTATKVKTQGKYTEGARKKDKGLGDPDLLSLKQQLAVKEIELAEEKIQIARRQRYKLDLELYKLEKELKLPNSEFTRPYQSICTSSMNVISYDILNSEDILIDINDGETSV